MQVPQQKLAELKSFFETDYFFETGFYHGHTTKKALESFDKTFSIEISSIHYNRGKEELKAEIDSGRFVFIHDDSANIGSYLDLLDKKTLFWLDAHNDQFDPGHEQGRLPTPIVVELEQIAKNNSQRHVIMVDDINIFKKQGGWTNFVSKDEVIRVIDSLFPDYNHIIVDSVSPNGTLIIYPNEYRFVDFYQYLN